MTPAPRLLGAPERPAPPLAIPFACYAAALALTPFVGRFGLLAPLRLLLALPLLIQLLRASRRPLGVWATGLGAVASLGAYVISVEQPSAPGVAGIMVFLLCWWVRRAWLPWIRSASSRILAFSMALAISGEILLFRSRVPLVGRKPPPLRHGLLDYLDRGLMGLATAWLLLLGARALRELLSRGIRRASIRLKLALAFGIFAITPAVLLATFLALSAYLHTGEVRSQFVEGALSTSSRAAGYAKALQLMPAPRTAEMAGRLVADRNLLRAENLQAALFEKGPGGWSVAAREGVSDSLVLPAAAPLADSSSRRVHGLALRAGKFYWLETALWPRGGDSLALVLYQPVDTAFMSGLSRSMGSDLILFTNIHTHTTTTSISIGRRTRVRASGKVKPRGIAINDFDDGFSDSLTERQIDSLQDLSAFASVGGGRWVGHGPNNVVGAAAGTLGCVVWDPPEGWREAGAVLLVHVDFLESLGLHLRGGNALSFGIQIALAVLGGLFLLMLIVAFLFGSRVASFITRGVTNLRAAANSIGQGDFDVNVTVPSEDEFGELATSFNKMAGGLRLGREAIIERGRLERELEMARRIQVRLLPAAPPKLPNIDLAAANAMSEQVGGDYYDFISMDHGRMGLCIADVSGHGVAAALLMGSVKAAFVSSASVDNDPSGVAGRVNRLLESSMDPGKFVTGFFANLDPRAMRLEYVNAGHPAPMLLRVDGRLERLEVGGLILGIDSKAKFEEGSVQLEVGDVLLFFTDGVTEAQGEDDELYGDDRIEALLRRERHRTSEQILATLVEDVKRFEGPRGPSDDLTAMVLRVVSAGPGDVTPASGAPA